MSFVTTPTRRSASVPHRAAIRLLLPEPTGPPTPTRSARSTGKEALPPFGVDGRPELEAHGGRRGQRPAVGGDARGLRGQLRRELGEPARADRGVERQQLQRGRRDRGRVVVEREQRGGLVVEPGGGGDDAERERAGQARLR